MVEHDLAKVGVAGSSPVFRSKSRPAKAERDLGAEDRARTGHLDLGKVALYQMSYFRDLRLKFKTLQSVRLKTFKPWNHQTLWTIKKNFTYFSDGKNKCCNVTIKILFVSRVVQGIWWYLNIGFTLVAVGVQIVTSAQNKSQN